MLILSELPNGYAFFECKDSAIQKISSIEKYFESLEKTTRFLKLRKFFEFESVPEATKSIQKIKDGKIPSNLKTILKTEIKNVKKGTSLLVADTKLAKGISKKFDVNVVSDQNIIMEMTRGIRKNVLGLINGVSEKDMNSMRYGIAHALFKNKIRFMTDQMDVMIIQALSILEEMEKEINLYSMRLREWYGFHFPELSRLIADNVIYAKVVSLIGLVENVNSGDLERFVTADIAQKIRNSAEKTIGVDVGREDMECILDLAEQVISLGEYRVELNNYLELRMNAIAPNLTAIAGEIIGARLISHAGSLLNLAKQPASTVQIFGAEKALFKALREKQKTPKYGLIFSSNIIGQTAGALKGKMARSFATNISICARIDAFFEPTDENPLTSDVGVSRRAELEKKLRVFENQRARKMMGSSKGRLPLPPKLKEYPIQKTYDTTADITENVFGSQKEKVEHSSPKIKKKNHKRNVDDHHQDVKKKSKS